MYLPGANSIFCRLTITCVGLLPHPASSGKTTSGSMWAPEGMTNPHTQYVPCFVTKGMSTGNIRTFAWLSMSPHFPI